MILVILGLIIYLIGEIGLLIDEFREGIAWGLLGLFAKPGHIIFSIIHFDRCKKKLGLIVLGFALVSIGVFNSYKQQLTSILQQSHDVVQHPAYRKEYRAGSQLPVGSRKAAPVCDEWPETGFWLSTNSGKRHNRKCENYRKTRGCPCTMDEGTPCGKCGG